MSGLLAKRGRPTDDVDSLGPSAGQKSRQAEPDSEDGVQPSSRWTPDQDELLRQAIAEFGSKNWKAIAERVPGRNHAQCLQRWNKVLKPGLVKGHWGADEDEHLVRLVQESTTVNWGEISKSIDGRTAKQCRERWKNHLDPSINKGPYSSDEDMLLTAAYGELGNRWTQIADRLPGRTEDSVKMRWKVLNPHSRAVAKPGRPPLISTHGKSSDTQSTASTASSPASSTMRQSSSHRHAAHPAPPSSLHVDPIPHDYHDAPAPHPAEMSSWTSLDPDAADLISRRASSMFESFKERDSSLLSFSSVKAEDWELFRELVLSDHFAQALPAAPTEMVSVFDSFKDKSMTDAEFRRLVGVIENPDAIMDFIHETYASVNESSEWCECGCAGDSRLCNAGGHHQPQVDAHLVAGMQHLNHHHPMDHSSAAAQVAFPHSFDSYGGQSNFQHTTSLYDHVDRTASFHDDDDDDGDDAMLQTFHVSKRR